MSIFKQKSKHKTEQKVIRVLERIEPRPRPQPAVAHAPGAGTNDVDAAAPPGGRRRRSRSRSRAESTRARTAPGGLAAARRRGGARLHSASPLPSSSGDETGRKRKAVMRNTPESSRLSDDDDDDDDAWVRLDARKRQRLYRGSGAVDLKRRLRHPQLWVGDDGEQNAMHLRIIHAAELACREQKCSPVLGLGDDEVQVELQYPGAKFPERYVLTRSSSSTCASCLCGALLVTQMMLTRGFSRLGTSWFRPTIISTSLRRSRTWCLTWHPII